MTFRDLIKKHILYEAVEKIKKGLSIFYKIDIKISNTEELRQKIDGEVAPETPEQTTPAAPETPVDTAVPAEVPVDAMAAPADPNALSPEAVPTETPPVDQTKIDEILNKVQASVQTEDEETKVSSNEEIVRKTEGSVLLTDEDTDKVQTVEDLIDLLGEKEETDGDDILDDFSVEVVRTMIDPDAANKASQIINRKDYIFLDVIFGSKKDENSIGIRISKRKNTDTVSLYVLKEGDILPVPFNIKLVNDQLLEIRNNFLNRSN